MAGALQPESIVRDGYERIADRYAEWASTELSPGRKHALALIESTVPRGASVLDLGCGTGVPMTAALVAAGYRVHGVDISSRQLELARRSVPEATFEEADIAAYDAQSQSYDAVVAFYSLTHLERTRLPALLARSHDWLRPGGTFVASLGVHDDPGTVEDEWLGVPMYFSHFDADTNLELIRAAGFDVGSVEIVADPEDGKLVEFLWVAARRQPPRSPLST